MEKDLNSLSTSVASNCSDLNLFPSEDLNSQTKTTNTSGITTTAANTGESKQASTFDAKLDNLMVCSILEHAEKGLLAKSLNTSNNSQEFIVSTAATTVVNTRNNSTTVTSVNTSTSQHNDDPNMEERERKDKFDFTNSFVSTESKDKTQSHSITATSPSSVSKSSFLSTAVNFRSRQQQQQQQPLLKKPTLFRAFVSYRENGRKNSVSSTKEHQSSTIEDIHSPNGNINSPTEQHSKLRGAFSKLSLASRQFSLKSSVTSGAHGESSSLESRLIFDLDNPSTRYILLHSKPAPEPVGGRSHLDCRRLETMEKLIVAMVDQIHGISIKMRRKNLRVFPLCAVGSEIVDWLYRNGKFLERWEAVRFAQDMMESGYLISADVDVENFRDDYSFYSFQNVYFWPSKNWSPSDLDYAVYLLRKTRDGKKALVEEEEKRLEKLQVTLKKDWDKVEIGVVKQLKYVEDIDKVEKRLFQMREAAFWKLHRPLNTNRGFFGEIEQKKDSLEKQHLTDSEYEATLNKEQLVVHLERRLYTLQVSFQTNRAKVSAASKSLIARTELWKPIDPLLNPDKFNPYKASDRNPIPSYSQEIPDRITPEEVNIWCSSFKELMNHKAGVEYFMKFLESEFSSENLKFLLKCQELDNEQSREEWQNKAKQIYNQFVAPKSANEINIEAKVRQAIIQKFEELEALEMKKPKKFHELDIYVFSEAMNRIQLLMAKDSFQRFCQWEVVKKLQQSPIQQAIKE